MGLIDKIDGGLTYLAEKGVQKYNWVTGGNKLDLANNLERVSSITGSSGFFLSLENNRVFGSIAGLLWIGGSYANTYVNSNNYEKEISARMGGCLDPVVEQSYSNDKKWGLRFGVLSAFLCNLGIHEVSTKDYVQGTGDLMLSGAFVVSGASAYIMSTREEPPHKDNCIKRGWQKSRELARKYLTPEPALIPALAKGKRLSI